MVIPYSNIQYSYKEQFVHFVLKRNKQHRLIMPMNASGAPMGGGGSLHDIMRHISAERKELRQEVSKVKAATTKLDNENAELKARMQDSRTAFTEQIAASKAKLAALTETYEQNKRILEQLGPLLLLRRGQRELAAPSSLGKRQREAAAAAAAATTTTTTTTTTDGAALGDAASHGRNDTDLDAYRRERDKLATAMEADAAAAARTTAAATTSLSSSTSTMTNGNSVQQMRDLASVYLFGLGRVGALQDLRQAPDAILPGNFVEQPIVAAPAAPTVVATTTNVELATAKTATATPVATATSTETKSPTAVDIAASTDTVVDDPTK
jgi:hypothetical protein